SCARARLSLPDALPISCGEVAAVPVVPDVRFRARATPEPQMLRLGGRDDEAGPVQLDAGRAYAFVGEQRPGHGRVHPHRQIRIRSEEHTSELQSRENLV